MSDAGPTLAGRLGARHYAIIIAAVAIAASITGLFNGFAFDDVQVIVKDSRLHRLSDAWRFFVEPYLRADLGATLYRPMTMVVFAVQWSFGGSPLAFHVTSILLYAALSAAVYRLGLTFMPARAAFIAGMLFAVHPVHVEAVANVVGQAEIWVAFIAVVAVTLYVQVRRKGDLAPLHTAGFAAAYLIACGFKEHAIVLPALFAAAELLVVKDERSVRARLPFLVPLAAAFCFVALAFLAARYGVLHGVAADTRATILKDQPFPTRFFTMLTVVVEWIRLFFWPMNLSADYSYPRLRAHDGFEISMLPALAVLTVVAWLAWSLRRRSSGATFGISWMAIALLLPSNLIVVTGFVLAERTLVLASAGFVLCAGLAVHSAIDAAEHAGRLARPLLIGAIGAIIAIFGARSATRNPVWRDNETVFRQTVADVPLSHRAHWMLAADLAERKRIPEALEEMDLAVMLSDGTDASLLAYGGDMFAAAGRCPRAVTLYKHALKLAPGNIQLRANTSWCLLRLGKPVDAKRVALEAGPMASDTRLQQMIRAADSVALTRAIRRAPL